MPAGVNMQANLTSDQQAVRWFLRLQEGPLDEDGEAVFTSWRSCPENASAFDRASRIWGVAGHVATEPEILGLRTRLLAGVEHRRFMRSGLIAATLILATLGSVALVINSSSLFGLRAAFQQSHPEERFVTAVGERTIATLRDGSIMTLNTDSRARVLYSGGERRILLDRGQAFFQVAKDVSRPFVVHAGKQRIMATGTAFDVRLNTTAVQVTLLKGGVLVGPNDKDSNGKQPTVQLYPGQKLLAEGRSIVSVSAADIEGLTSWTSGKMIFRDTRLADAVDESNRYSGTQITLADKDLGDLPVNGVFLIGRPLEFAQAVAYIHPIEAQRDASGQIRIARLHN